jgi:mRNA-degrading endonuclease HigB of HigAB toxin-antitoxin module
MVFFIKLILRNILRHRLRSGLTATGIVVAIVAFGMLRTLVDAWYAGAEESSAYVDAREPILAWYRQVLAADWVTPSDIKRDFGSASILRDGRVVFNIVGSTVTWVFLRNL